MGKAGFARIQDRSGRVQVYVKKNIVGEEAFATWKRLMWATTSAVRRLRHRTGEATIQATTLALAGKCIASTPDKHKGITDIVKSRQRYVDLSWIQRPPRPSRRRPRSSTPASSSPP